MSTTTSLAITKPDENAIRHLVALGQESHSDPQALMALHTAGTAIVNLAGRRVLDRKTYATAMTDALASPLSDVLTTAEVMDIRLATPDIAIVSCTKTVHDGRSGGDGSTVLPSTGALTYVTVRSADGWRIALAQTTTHPYAHQRRLGLADG